MKTKKSLTKVKESLSQEPSVESVAKESYIVKSEPIHFIQPSNPFRVYEFPLLFSKQECHRLTVLARPFLKRSAIHNALYSSSLIVSGRRTSQSCSLSNEITTKIQAIAQTLTGFPLEHMEYTEVIKYNQGQMFDFHYDAEPTNKQIPSWSRVATIMVYLNDNFDGGETEFKEINARIRPEQGKVVLFWSVVDGTLIPESLHRGCLISKGTKWLANQWVHSVPMPYK
jgi:hypothetical protein